MAPRFLSFAASAAALLALGARAQDTPAPTPAAEDLAAVSDGVDLG